jgi:hypothetical protein
MAEEFVDVAWGNIPKGLKRLELCQLRKPLMALVAALFRPIIVDAVLSATKIRTS